MSLKDDWKNFGKNTGKAFSNFGKSVGKTAKAVVSDEKLETDEEGHSELGNSWKKTGKSFGTAGKSLGHAFKDTGKTIVGKDIDEPVDDASEVVNDEERKTK